MNQIVTYMFNSHHHLQQRALTESQCAVSVGINSFLSIVQRPQPMQAAHLCWSTLRWARGSLLWGEQGEALSSTCLAL